jgi:SP family sugar:H+ symporter-like MFS transporter
MKFDRREAMTATLGAASLGFYALSAFLLFFFMRAMVQETGGRTVEEMAG